MYLLFILVLIVNMIIFMLDHFYLLHMPETQHLGMYIYSIYNALVISYLVYSYLLSAEQAQQIQQQVQQEPSLLNSELLQNIISTVQSNPAIIKQLSKLLK